MTAAGTDGSLLSLLNMLAHVRNRAEGGSRVAIIMNGSPLFTVDAGSRESGCVCGGTALRGEPRKP